MTTAQLTARYNELVKAAGDSTKFKPVKMWKGKKADLEARIRKLEKSTKSEQPAVDGVRLSEIAREHDIDPKAARARFRRLSKKHGATMPTPIKGWTFAKRDAKRVTNILTNKEEVAA